MRQAFYLLVTADEFELPVFQGKPKEVADYLGMKPCSLRSSIARNYKMKCGRQKVMCIKISDNWKSMEEEI